MKNRLRDYAVAAALSLIALSAEAADPYPLTIEWQWPTLDCEGGTIALEDIDAAEIYLDTSPIPSASEGDPCLADGDVPPASPIVQTVTTTETSVVVPVDRGETWHARMRVQVNGEWSNLSAEFSAEVPFAQPRIPIIIRIGP